LVLGLGGLISGLLVFTFAPQAEGHGTDAAIEAVHRDPRSIRLRAVFVKVIASAATIGSGGREGPTAQIAAGLGSWLARRLRLADGEARTAVAVGIGSGIGAIFSAPLGGAVLAADILYREDLEAAVVLPAMVAGAVAYAIFGAALGFRPLLSLPGSYAFHEPL